MISWIDGSDPPDEDDDEWRARDLKRRLKVNALWSRLATQTLVEVPDDFGIEDRQANVDSQMATVFGWAD